MPDRAERLCDAAFVLIKLDRLRSFAFTHWCNGGSHRLNLSPSVPAASLQPKQWRRKTGRVPSANSSSCGMRVSVYQQDFEECLGKSIF